MKKHSAPAPESVEIALPISGFKGLLARLFPGPMAAVNQSVKKAFTSEDFSAFATGERVIYTSRGIYFKNGTFSAAGEVDLPPFANREYPIRFLKYGLQTPKPRDFSPIL